MHNLTPWLSRGGGWVMRYSRNATRSRDVVVGIDGINKTRNVLLDPKTTEDRAGTGDDGRGLG